MEKARSIIPRIETRIIVGGLSAVPGSGSWKGVILSNPHALWRLRRASEPRDMFGGLFGLSTARSRTDKETPLPDPGTDSMAEAPEHGSLGKLALAALGVVYGDI